MKTSWAVILCKFSDSDIEPFPLQHYKDLFTGSATGPLWNMPRYFRDATHGAIDLAGTKVFGWYKLDKSVSDYNKLGGLARHDLVEWARAAAEADGVDLDPYFSVVVCTNLWHDIGAAHDLSGVVSQGADTLTSMHLGHEMGHIYGARHSRTFGSDVDYADPWDIMSAGNANYAKDSTFSSIGPLFNAANMQARGWLDPTRVWDPKTGGLNDMVVLRPLDRTDLNGALAARLPSGRLVEFRIPERWDAGIPRACILVHELAGGISYLVPNNAGSYEFLEGDSLGEVPEPPAFVDPFRGTPAYERIDVEMIDAPGHKAMIRVRASRGTGRPIPVAGDPMATILKGGAYLRWLEWKHPHVPKVDEVRAFLRTLGAEERREVLAQAKLLGQHVALLEKANAGVARAKPAGAGKPRAQRRR